MSNAAILREWYDRVWEQGDLDSIDSYFTPKTEALGMMDFAVGPEDFKTIAAAIHEMIEDIRIRFEKTVECGDWVWVQISSNAVSKLDGAAVSIHGQVMCRFENGKFCEIYNQFDMLGFFEQMGLLPENAMALFLSGERLS